MQKRALRQKKLDIHKIHAYNAVMSCFRMHRKHLVLVVVVCLYFVQLILCCYKSLYPVYEIEKFPYKLEVYGEISVVDFVPCLGIISLSISGDQIILIKKVVQRGESWELRVDTGEKTLDWENTYLQITNYGELNQGVQVMRPDMPGNPDYSIISASDYIFHNL